MRRKTALACLGALGAFAFAAAHNAEAAPMPAPIGWTAQPRGLPSGAAPLPFRPAPVSLIAAAPGCALFR